MQGLLPPELQELVLNYVSVANSGTHRKQLAKVNEQLKQRFFTWHHDVQPATGDGEFIDDWLFLRGHVYKYGSGKIGRWRLRQYVSMIKLDMTDADWAEFERMMYRCLPDQAYTIQKCLDRRVRALSQQLETATLYVGNGHARCQRIIGRLLRKARREEATRSE